MIEETQFQVQYKLLLCSIISFNDMMADYSTGQTQYRFLKSLTPNANMGPVESSEYLSSPLTLPMTFCSAHIFEVAYF